MDLILWGYVLGTKIFFFKCRHTVKSVLHYLFNGLSFQSFLSIEMHLPMEFWQKLSVHIYMDLIVVAVINLDKFVYTFISTTLFEWLYLTKF